MRERTEKGKEEGAQAGMVPGRACGQGGQREGRTMTDKARGEMGSGRWSGSRRDQEKRCRVECN